MKRGHYRPSPAIDLMAPLPESAKNKPLEPMKVVRRIRDTLDDKQERIRKANGFI